MSEQRHRILIVEDNAEDRAVYRRRIAQGREQDYQFWETASGEDGLRLCLEVNPDCVLLDYQLPDLDGLAFLERLRADVRGAAMTVIMLTGHGSETVAVQAMKGGPRTTWSRGSTATTCGRPSSRPSTRAACAGRSRSSAASWSGCRLSGSGSSPNCGCRPRPCPR